ncbi:MAG TPA: phosphodiester glycosidase family protein [Candidatus Baltobacteraceae bacterium]|nr:phosphodiester glycosidase family protein [Candidatus Baltobacteraceae bacterium]
MTRAASALAAAFALLAAASASRPALALPADLAPSAPFPHVLFSTVEQEPVAPGIARATYRLATAAGPVVVSVVSADPRVASVRLGVVLAHDRIVSNDETVPSMARRTGAVAGINGDYFDINGTGAPLGLAVVNGVLERSPSARVALTVGRDGELRFETFRFAGIATSGAVSVPVSALNVWPPQGGAAVLTPAFGAVPPASGVVVESLVPEAGAASPGGDASYRVTDVADAPPYPAAGLRLAYGAAARALGALPGVGDAVTLAYGTEPPLQDAVAAIGGGPLLLRDGAPVDDPLSPNYAERGRRIPAAAAGVEANGTLLLVAVDGRRPSVSIGVDRAELTALLRALGATDAMLLDSGGSATLVARPLGDPAVALLNDPSDGAPRPVADGLFAYSDAPYGGRPQLVIRPRAVRALTGARVALASRLVDASDHPLGALEHGAWRIAGAAGSALAAVSPDGVLEAGPRAGAGRIRIARGGYAAELPVRIVDRVSRLALGPPRLDPEPGSSLTLDAEAFDDRQRPIAVDGRVRWTARGASVTPDGRLTVGDRDAEVSASAGGVTTTALVPVGRHVERLALFDGAHRSRWTFATAPAGGSGSLSFSADTLRLGYDFTTGGRAAYANGDVPLGEPLDLTCTVVSDANGEALRAVLADRYGDRATVTLVRALDAPGTVRATAAVPAWLAPPVALRSLYVVGTLAAPPVVASGVVGVRDCSATVPGTPPPPSAAQPSPSANSSSPP